MTGERRDSEVLGELRAEHLRLRSLIARCREQAVRILTGAADDGGLVACVADLLDAVEEHNASEEALLRPILLAVDSFGPVRVDQMMDHHVAEHARLRQGLREAADRKAPGAAARATLEAARQLEGHMDREENEFLNDRVLRDDLVSLDMFSG